MNYTLIGSLRSPFVRMVRIFLLSNKIEFKFKVIDYLENPADAKYLASESPLNKIPILQVGDENIYDSRVIFNYLTKQHGLLPPTLEQENMLTVINGMLDVYVNLFMLKRSGINIDDSSWYVDRQKARIEPSLNYVIPWVKTLTPNEPSDWNAASMALYSFLFWAKFRGFLDLSPYPDLLSFLTAFQQADGVEETTIKS